MAEENIYKKCRTDCGFTRSEASEKLGFITESRLEKIENEKYHITPEEVVAMQNVYRKPNLCNWYCTHECAIGKETNMPEIKEKTISEIVLEMLATLNKLNSQKDRLIEITSDGKFDDDDELRDFIGIQKQLEKISGTIDSLKLWVDSTVASGEVDIEKFNKYMK